MALIHNGMNNENRKWITLQNECGTFRCDEEGYAYEFIPFFENLVDKNVVRKLIVPDGIIGFADGFGRGLTVEEEFRLPETLKSIGSDWYTKRFYPGGEEARCVFADCKLPTVILPDHLELLGMYAFGGCRIDTMCLTKFIKTQPCRNFRAIKDSSVRRLFVPEDLPEEIMDSLKHHGWTGSSFFDGTYEECFVYKEKESGCLPTEYIPLEEYSKKTFGTEIPHRSNRFSTGNENLQWKYRKLKFYPEDEEKMAAMDNIDEKLEFIRKLKKENRYIILND